MVRASDLTHHEESKFLTQKYFFLIKKKKRQHDVERVNDEIRRCIHRSFHRHHLHSCCLSRHESFPVHWRVGDWKSWRTDCHSLAVLNSPLAPRWCLRGTRTEFLTGWQRRRERTCLGLLAPGGRWSTESLAFVRLPAKARGQTASCAHVRSRLGD